MNAYHGTTTARLREGTRRTAPARPRLTHMIRTESMGLYAIHEPRPESVALHNPRPHAGFSGGCGPAT